nr:AAA domain-containing protein [Nakamurella flavida]
MRELYREDDGVIPPPLRAILTTEDPTAATADGTAARPVTEGLLLLPLPANEQQQQILRLARSHPGVVVQGPPGTGKSHTIANLISHFVADGKRVLVVAEKEQALAVLADKVPEEIRDLTVSVLGADEDGRRRLGGSIRQIQSRVGQVDPVVADARISQLEGGIDDLDRRAASLTTQLRETRRAEITELPGDWLAGGPLTPQAAAQWVSEHEEFGAVPDPLTPATPAPLTTAEFVELVELVRTVGADAAREAGRALPDRSRLLSGADFRRMIDEHVQLGAQADRGRTALRRDGVRGTDLPHLTELAGALNTEAEWRRTIDGGWRARLLAQHTDTRLVDEWASAAGTLAALRDRAFTLRARLRAHAVRLPETTPPDLERDLQDAVTRLRGSGKIGLFARDARRALEACTVDGRPPATAEGAQLCLDALSLEVLRHQMATLWMNQAGPLGAEPLAGYPEESLGARLDQIRECRDAHQRWDELRHRLTAVGLAAPTDPTADALDDAAHLTRAVAALARQRAVDEQLTALAGELRTGATAPAASSLWLRFADAAVHRDVRGWDESLEDLAGLERIALPSARLTVLQRRLSAAAPVWASAILQDADAAGPPDEFLAMWQWRQLETWLGQVAAGHTPAELQADLEQVAQDRRRAVTELVSEKAWRRLVDNLGHQERQALQAYVAAVNRYGRTGGKFAQRWITEMRSALEDATTAVPVWIMPTSRALSSFRPAAVPPFDVLIVDEASQIGFEALPLLSLASSTIIVGDDKQTSPEHVGLDRARIFDLMDDFLRDIPRYRTVFDPDKSLYDLAMLRFSRPVMLTEHFRCLPAIIEFSNRHAYDGQIIPLRDRPPRPGWQPLQLVRVPDGFRRGFVNEPEADAVVDLLERLHGSPDHDGMTFGVVCLLGTAQSTLVRDRLYDRLGPEVLLQRQIRVGEAANFQGDERDVMVISTVVAVDPTRPDTRFGAMTKEADLRRINVAASRARHQMWVVTSVDSSMLPNGDLRAALIRHCSDPAEVEEARTDLLERCESEFEKRVVRALLERGYRDVTVQHKVGRYRLDIVVSGPDARLAIECDGDRWHGDDAWDRDRARQEVLERAGWTFERIRGSSFFRDPALAMEPVWERLDSLGIPTGDHRTGTRPGAAPSAVATTSPRATAPPPAGGQPGPTGDHHGPDHVGPEHGEPDHAEPDHTEPSPDRPEHDLEHDGPTPDPSEPPAAAAEPAWQPPAWYRALSADDPPAAARAEQRPPTPPAAPTPGTPGPGAALRLESGRTLIFPATSTRQRGGLPRRTGRPGRTNRSG